MIATTTLETILVSATGDVLTCRSRDDADTFFPTEETNQPQTTSTHGAMNLQLSSSKKLKDFYCKDCHSWTKEGSMQIDFCYVPDDARNKRTIAFPSMQHKTSQLPGTFRSVSVPRMRGGLLGGSNDCDGNRHEDDWYNWGQYTGLRGGLLGGTAVTSRATHIKDYQNGGISHGLSHASDSLSSRLLQSLVPSFDDHSETDESLDSLSVGARRETVPGRSPIRKENKFIKALAYMKVRGTNSKSETITTSYNTETIKSMCPFLMHGIPTFMSSLAQIAVTKVSAHPMGKHVLLISNDALLFSYGENDYGQLGQGTISGFVQTPTIVTSLLENGGKTVDCATGMNYSLVVVKTEGGRISRMRRASPLNMASRTFSYDAEDAPGTKVANNPIWHHQLYGFGQNNYMQLGLENPFSLERTSSPIGLPSTPPKKSLNIENAWLPRRAALHCETWEEDEVNSNSLAPHGIFSIACGEYHSAALVRSSNGKVEVYTWGKVDDGALGLSSEVFQETQNIMLEAYQARAEKSNLSVSNKSALQSVPIPTVVSSLTYDPTLDQSASNSGSCPQLEIDYPTKVALGPKCTMVITSSGRCLSFGKSDDGLLGLGENIRTSTVPMEIQFPISATNGDDKYRKHNWQTKIKVSSVSIGARHAVAVTKDNTAFSWGQSMNGRLGCVDSFSHEFNAIPMKPGDENEDPGSCVIWTPRQVIIPRQELNRSNTTKSSRKAPPKENLPPIAKLQRNISMNNLRDDTESRHVHKDYTTTCVTKDVNPCISVPIVDACAGYDNSIFVTKSGQVLSCGKQSGRLGRGEVLSDTPNIKPLFGGLHLWQER